PAQRSSGWPAAHARWPCFKIMAGQGAAGAAELEVLRQLIRESADAILVAAEDAEKRYGDQREELAMLRRKQDEMHTASREHLWPTKQCSGVSPARFGGGLLVWFICQSG
ncbi:unnamed protein product, partial [Prorocentrum cordatum]